MMTLISLWKEVQPLMYKVAVLCLIYMRGIHAGRQLKLPSQKATLLLTTLYNCLITSDTLFEPGLENGDTMEFSMQQDSAETVSLITVKLFILVGRKFCGFLKKYILRTLEFMDF